MISSIFEKIASFYCLHIPLDAPKKLEWDSAYFIQKKDITLEWVMPRAASIARPGRTLPSACGGGGTGHIALPPRRVLTFRCRPHISDDRSADVGERDWDA